MSHKFTSITRDICGGPRRGNDAPVLGPGFTSISSYCPPEDAGVPAGVVGSLISSFTGGREDVDKAVLFKGKLRVYGPGGPKNGNGTGIYTTNTNGTKLDCMSAPRSTPGRRLLLAEPKLPGHTTLLFAPWVPNLNRLSPSAFGRSQAGTDERLRLYKVARIPTAHNGLLRVATECGLMFSVNAAQ